MGAKIQAFDIFQTPLSSHYPLPLIGNLLSLKNDLNINKQGFELMDLDPDPGVQIALKF